MKSYSRFAMMAELVDLALDAVEAWALPTCAWLLR